MPENPDRYSHGHHESVLRSHRWRTAENSAAFLLPHLRPGMSLLDIGCGPGNITADLADRVGHGPVVGLDLPPDVIATAAADHVRPNLTFRVGDVYALDIADDSFDVVYAHQVLQHLSDPVAAMREMRRVVKPGGIVAVRDSDYGAFVWTPDDPMLTRWNELYHELTRRNRAEADAGRYLHTWVRAAGFDDFVLSHSAWTFQNDADRTWWGGLWADRALHSEFAKQCLDEGLFVLLHGEVIARK